MTQLSHHQPELFGHEHTYTADELYDELASAVRGRLDLRLTRNRVSMLSVEFKDAQSISVRMHEGFLRAPPGVIHALVVYLRTRRRAAWRKAAAYARSIEPSERRSGRKCTLTTRGDVYDLAAISRHVNATHFQGRVKCNITWGRPSRRRGRARSLRFGSWNPVDRLVRINPCLDRADVPEVFVRYIVFHEMLHAVVPPVRRGGRVYHHTPQFRALERSFPGWRDMHAMAKDLVSRL